MFTEEQWRQVREKVDYLADLDDNLDDREDELRADRHREAQIMHRHHEQITEMCGAAVESKKFVVRQVTPEVWFVAHPDGRTVQGFRTGSNALESLSRDPDW